MEISTLQEEEIVASYVECAGRLEAALGGLSENELDQAGAEGGWTIRQYTHHVADGDDLWKIFIKRALGSASGAFQLEWYWQMPQEAWGEAWGYAGRAIEPSLALLRASRAHVAQLLRGTPGGLERCLAVRMPDGSERPVSVGEMVAMQTRHVEGHIADIEQILAFQRNGDK